MSKILVVDDSPTMRNLVEHALMVDGHQMESAADGLEGLEKFGSFEPDLVVADVNMPRLDGIKMIEAIRSAKKGGDVSIVVLTTESSDEIKGRLKAVGANAWIAKPFEDSMLRDIVRDFVN